MKKIPIHFQIIISLVLGLLWALISGYLGWNQFTKDWIAPFGDIFIRGLKLIAVPLVLFSIISGITGLSDISKLGRMGGKTILLYLSSTIFAVAIGLSIVNVIKPGDYISDDQKIKNRISYESWANQNDIELLDDKNFLLDPQYDHLKNESDLSIGKNNASKMKDKIKKASKTNNESPLSFVVNIVPENFFLSLGSNRKMLQIIFFAIFFGICIISVGKEKVSGLIQLIDNANMVFLKMVDFIMKGAPFFVFALISGVLAKMANTPSELFELFKSLGMYSLAVLMGLSFMVFLVYPMMLRLLAKNIGYKEFFKKVSPVQLLAFSTSSSAATLPVTMDCMKKELGVKKEVASFVVPIGATVNMDGTSLYQAIAAIFLAQLHGLDLTFAQQATIIATSTLASIGTAAVPSAGVIMLIIIMQSLGLNPAWIAIILPVDRILDMCRTVVNVTGDMTVCKIVNDSEK